jgi:hypothetical protein
VPHLPPEGGSGRQSILTLCIVAWRAEHGVLRLVWLEVEGVEQVQLVFFNVAAWVEGSDVAGVEAGGEQAVAFGGGKVLFEQAEIGRAGGGIHAMELADADEVFWVEGSVFALLAFDGVEWIGGNEDRVSVGISGEGPFNDGHAEFFLGIVVAEASEPAVEDFLAGSAGDCWQRRCELRNSISDSHLNRRFKLHFLMYFCCNLQQNKLILLPRLD